MEGADETHDVYRERREHVRAAGDVMSDGTDGGVGEDCLRRAGGAERGEGGVEGGAEGLGAGLRELRGWGVVMAETVEGTEEGGAWTRG